MKHMLMDPAFPDLVAAAAAAEKDKALQHRRNRPMPEDAVDAFLTFLGKIQVAPSRLW
jgi:hypothetical protein